MNRKMFSLNEIYWSPEEETYFLIPHGENIPQGKFLLENMDGEKTYVTKDIALSYALSEDTIQATLEESLEASTQALKESFLQLSKFSNHRKLKGIRPEHSPNVQTNILSEIDSIVDKLPSGIKTILSNLEDQPSQYIQKIRNELATGNISIDQDVLEGLQKIQESLDSGEVESFISQITDKVQKSLNQPPEILIKNSEKIISEAINEIFEEERTFQKEQENSIKNAVSDSIANSFRSLGLKSNAGGDL